MNQLSSIDLLPFAATSVISNENLEVNFYRDHQIMHYIWKQRTTGDAYRQAFLDGLKFSEKNPTKYFLSDIRNQGIVGPADRKWFEEVALPKGISFGLKKSAMVFDGNTFKLYYINMIIKYSSKKGLPMKFFKTIYEAQEWLLSD